MPKRWRTWLSASPTQPWEMAALADLPPAFWIPWLRWACHHSRYGIRYEYGMFAQDIQGGCQTEYPDPWLQDGTPWEFPRADITYPVRFGGWVEHLNGKAVWQPSGEVEAKAYDMVIPGHATTKVSTLRLWKAVAPAHIDLGAFNTATMRVPRVPRMNTKTFHGCCIQTTARQQGVSCVSNRSISLSQHPFRIW